MNKDSLDLLKQLVDTASPSGFEVGIQQVIRAKMSSYSDEVRLDVHGNVIGVLNPGAQFRVMLAGHCDEIGFIITHIDDKGFAYVASVGGVDVAVAQGQRLIVHNQKAPVHGVIGRKPVHLARKDDGGEKHLKVHDLWIDIGARNRKEAEKLISVGDYATVDAGFIELRNGLVAARGFDDRIGAFVVIETLRKLKGKKCKVGVYGVSTVQEEIGLRGARTSAYSIDPHVGIAVDVGHASDYPGIEVKIVGQCTLGKGPVLHRGPNINPVLGRMLEDVARKSKIPFQVTAEPTATGTDANSIQISRAGVAAALVSIPNRYMHTPVEVIALEDVENASRLLAEFILRLEPGTNFIPGAKRPAV